MLSACTDDAAVVPHADLALFRVQSGDPPDYSVVLMDSNGKNARAITTNTTPALFGRPAWSPDGTKIALATNLKRSSDSTPVTDIYVYDADGAHGRRLTRTGDAGAPVWSPDGQTIVFARFRYSSSYTSSIWSVRVDGSRQQQVLPQVKNQLDIPGSWSPDGTLLAFTRTPSPKPAPDGRLPNGSAVYVVGADGTGLHKLLRRASDPAWSPDGQTMAYRSDRDENGELSYGDIVFYANELYLMNSDGTDKRRLTRTKDLNEAMPAWSPDGQWIAYQRGKVTGNAEGTSIFLLASDQSCNQAIAHDPQLNIWYTAPAWRPGALGASCP